jgi:hypothetical protein
MAGYHFLIPFHFELIQDPRDSKLTDWPPNIKLFMHNRFCDQWLLVSKKSLGPVQLRSWRWLSGNGNSATTNNKGETATSNHEQSFGLAYKDWTAGSDQWRETRIEWKSTVRSGILRVCFKWYA